MDQAVKPAWMRRYDRLFRSIQRRLADQIKIPVETRLWGDHCYRFGTGEPVISVLVRDRDGLAAPGGMDELKICEAYMAGRPFLFLFA
jgi:cyclopropane-fatty-acyl-phospholipid synthase